MPLPAHLVASRRILHGIAESLLAGPQYRACGRIALRVTTTGFATVGEPALRLAVDRGVPAVVVDESRRTPLAGTFGDIGVLTGAGFGEPEGIYGDHIGVGADEPVVLDPQGLDLLVRWFVMADAALRVFAPRQTPSLWPEHFDVAVDLDGTTFGASPGDGFCPSPYVYVSTADPSATAATDAYWNAPFGAFVAYEQVPTLGELVGFLRRGRSLLGG